MDQISALSAVEIFEQLAMKFNQTVPSAQDLSDILLIMGKSGKENFRMLTEGLSDMQQQAHEAGAIMDQETIQQIADMKDEFAAFMQTMMPMFAKFATFAMDAAENVVHGLKAIWESFSQGLQTAAEEMSKVWGMFKEGDVLGAAAQVGKSVYKGMDKSADVLVDHTDQFIERQSAKEARRRAKAEAAHKQGVGLQQMERLETLLANQAGGKMKGPAVDSMAKMGLFIGGRQDPIIKKADKQIGELQKANETLMKLNQTVDKKL